MNEDKDTGKEAASLTRRAEMLRLRRLRLERAAVALRETHSDILTIALEDGFHRDYRPFVQKVKAENLWETEWLDTGCEPPETFTYGATIEATLTCGIAQRMVVQRLLEQMGL